MDAVTGYILTGTLAGAAGGVVNLLLWMRTLRHTHLMGIRLHKGFAHSISRALEELPEQLDARNLQQVQNEILKLFDTFMAERLTQKMPVLGMFMDDKLIAEIRDVFREEMETHLPKLLMENLTAEKNSNAISKLLTSAVTRGLQAYAWHAVAYTLIGAICGGAIGYAVSCLG